MCGIVGYIGKKEAYPVLINGLKKLEYRGYDSSGIMLSGKKTFIRKTKGKVSDLEILFKNEKDKKGCKAMPSLAHLKPIPTSKDNWEGHFFWQMLRTLWAPHTPAGPLASRPTSQALASMPLKTLPRLRAVP